MNNFFQRSQPFDVSPYIILDEQQARDLVSKAQKAINQLLSEITNQHDNFEGVYIKLDEIHEISVTISNMFEAYLLIGTNLSLVQTIRELSQNWQIWTLENITMSSELYHIAQKSFESACDISAADSYHAENILDSFKRAGAALDGEKRKKFVDLQHKLTALDLQFNKNLQECQDGIWICHDEMQGLSPDFIETLTYDHDKKIYFLGVDYPTYHAVMQDCSVAKTRTALYKKFIQRAYPENLSILEEIRRIRQEIARILGYENYADFDCANTMAQNAQEIENFLNLVDSKTHEQALLDKQGVFSSLDDTIRKCLSNPSGELTGSDVAFIVSQLEKKIYDIDQAKLAEYFPAQQTIARILKVYASFFEVTFQKRTERESWWWIDDLIVIDVLENNNVLGTFIFDLYPRKNKYTHACHCTIAPTHTRNGIRTPSLALIVANFFPPTKDRDGLLKFDEVVTFFHELGHGMHSLFGSARFCSDSGTAVKIDFVEVPSQMLEQWAWKPEIIKKMSGHYKTGEALNAETIEQLCKSRVYLQSILFFQRQVFQARYSLNIYRSHEDAVRLKRELAHDIVRFAPLDHDDHFECAFGHLMWYAAKYYVYLWSLVYALDLFEYIDKHGFDNPEVGKRFRKEILEPGGSQDPRVLVKKFLGREVAFDALLRFVQH